MASKDDSTDPPAAADDGEASDPELEELLDLSLNEFGKHAQKQPSPPPKKKPAAPPPGHLEREFGEAFSEGFAAQAEEQLGEVMRLMQSENPEIWKQFEEFSKSMEGIPPGPLGGVASHGESSVDDKPGAREESLSAVLEETLHKLKQSTLAGPEPQGDDEDQLLEMMQGMMSSLLSKDVLYPSLSELCKQYPEWLRDHKDSVSAEDFERYSRQLDIMRSICAEFERQGETPSKQSSDNILQLMQQLQGYGQPPPELSQDSAGPGLMPPGADPQSCSLM